VPPSRPQVLKERSAAPFNTQVAWPKSYTDFNNVVLTLCNANVQSPAGAFCPPPAEEPLVFATDLFGTEEFYYLVSNKGRPSGNQG
jgi:hypothetical protein